MGVFRADGTRVTRSTFPTVAPANVPLEVTQDLWLTTDFESRESKNPAGDKRTLLARKGKIITQRDIDALFPTAIVTSVTPTTSPLTGGRVIEVVGDHLDGVTAVTVGGVAATAVTVVRDDLLRFTTPALAAGTHAVVLVDDAGNVGAGNITAA